MVAAGREGAAAGGSNYSTASWSSRLGEDKAPPCCWFDDSYKWGWLNRVVLAVLTPRLNLAFCLISKSWISCFALYTIRFHLEGWGTLRQIHNSEAAHMNQAQLVMKMYYWTKVTELVYKTRVQSSYKLFVCAKTSSQSLVSKSIHALNGFCNRD